MSYLILQIQHLILYVMEFFSVFFRDDLISMENEI